jgi:tetratricopeptide (TPR) repeat protein
MKYLLFFLVSTIAISAIGQTSSGAFEKANQLIAEKKYDSAFKNLNDADPDNNIPDIVLLKMDIALKYFITSISHQFFGLKDLKPEEDIFELRGKEGSYSMYNFPVNEILDKLIKLYPNNYHLKKGLADYYYEVHLKYGSNWIIETDELLNLIKTNYSLAIENGVYDYLSFYTLGYLSLLNEDYKNAIASFDRSIKLKDDYASSYYNLAYAYLSQNERQMAIPNAKKAYDLYTDSVYKGDAARMIAVIYAELDSISNSIVYYEQSNIIDPENYYTVKPLLDLYLKTNDDKYKMLTDDFFNLAPDNPTIYNDLISIYHDSNKGSEVIKFLESKLSTYKANEAVFANINFYLGRAYFDLDKKKAIVHFEVARDTFKKVFDKKHPVFKMIDDAIMQLK